jgi:hypothetical protein
MTAIATNLQLSLPLSNYTLLSGLRIKIKIFNSAILKFCDDSSTAVEMCHFK